MGKISPEKRSNIMRGVVSKNTKPEMLVRHLLHRLGYRYTLHARGLPGKPDIVFSRRRKAIFIHGCFWHQHPATDCRISRRPTSNTEFWNAKLDRNIERDRASLQGLQRLGWTILTLWECELNDANQLELALTDFLGPTRFLAK